MVVILLAGAALIAAPMLPVVGATRWGLEQVQERLGDVGQLDLVFPRLPQRSTIYDAEGRRLAVLYLDENRRVVRLRQVPEVVRRAVLAIEDAGFYDHPGVDRKAVLRALVSNVTSGEVEQGASTITQQLARRAFPEVGQEETIGRKLREASVALRLDREYTKDEILEIYLNDVYFGAGAYGIGTAAHRYFAKSVRQLTLREAALLAGLIAGPERFSPFRDREAAIGRRNVVLDRMAELGWITAERAEKAKEAPIRLRRGKPLELRQPNAPHFVEFVKRTILSDPRFGRSRATRQRVLFQGGLEIHTTLDLREQRAARRAARRHLPLPNDPEAALAAVEPGTGAIRALLGGKDFDEHKFDAASQGRRQPGSAFKPFTLIAALEKGFRPTRSYDSSSPKELDIGGGRTWEVHNATGGGFGRVDLVTATYQSINVVYAQLILDVGPRRVVRTAQRMGIESRLPAVPSLTLGTAGVTPLEMAGAYATLANRGVHCEPFAIRRVVDRDGEVMLEQERGECRRAVERDIALRVVSILEQVIERGTGTAANLGRRPAFGKTGTTDDYGDAWFAGCTRQLCAASWVGHLRGRVPMTDVHGIRVFGGTFPARIWHDFMAGAMSDAPVRGFPEPPPLERDGEDAPDRDREDEPRGEDRDADEEEREPVPSPEPREPDRPESDQPPAAPEPPEQEPEEPLPIPGPTTG